MWNTPCLLRPSVVSIKARTRSRFEERPIKAISEGTRFVTNLDICYSSLAGALFFVGDCFGRVFSTKTLTSVFSVFAVQTIDQQNKGQSMLCLGEKSCYLLRACARSRRRDETRRFSPCLNDVPARCHGDRHVRRSRTCFAWMERELDLLV
jgi:hypothetical protein